jgi:predicted HAD superfamily Cof-like phosphohydrolase
VTPLEQVTEFHRAFGCAINQPWTVELGALRARLIAEECRELGEALLAGDPLNVARELADLAYVVLGTAVTFGIGMVDAPQQVNKFGLLCVECAKLSWLEGPLLHGYLAEVIVRLHRVIPAVYGVAVTESIDLNAAITAVHSANMSKLGPDGKPIYRLDGKVLKGPNFRAPDLSVALAGAR